MQPSTTDPTNLDDDPLEYCKPDPLTQLTDRTPLVINDGRFRKSSKERWFECDDCGVVLHNIFLGNFLAYIKDPRGVPPIQVRWALWMDKRWDATWLCTFCWGRHLDKPLPEIQLLLGITQRRDFKRATWRNWDSPGMRLKRLNSGTLPKAEKSWIPNNYDDSRWVIRQPKHVNDDRLSTPSATQNLCCDECGTWKIGFRSGSFTYLGRRPENTHTEVAWSRGLWNAEWRCAKCISWAATRHDRASSSTHDTWQQG